MFFEVDVMSSPWSQAKYIQALKFAAGVHRGQTIPGSDLPYVVHAAMVAMEVLAVLAREDGLDGDLAVQCALLHDVIEDAGVSHANIAAAFGPAVADGVLALSKNGSLESKTQRMADSLKRIEQQPKEVAIVKLADRITNLQPPPEEWYGIEGKVEAYRDEGRVILRELGGASPYLSARLRNKLHQYPTSGFKTSDRVRGQGAA